MKLRRTPPRRRGFTLIELMVVIGIIILLVSLLTGSIILAIGKVDQVRTQKEIGALAQSLKQFESDFNIAVPPPSRLWLDDSMVYNTASPPAGIPATVAPQLAADSQAFLRKVWPRLTFGTGATPVNWSGTGTGNKVLEGEEVLVFFLGGARSGSVFNGFATDPVNPMNPSSSKRKGPYFQFDTNRLTAGPSGVYLMYNDPYGTNMPYAYFSSGKSANGYNPYPTLGPDCPSILAQNTTGTPAALLPYFQTSGTVTQFYNADTFQIISAGKDGKFGPGGLWSPTSGPAGTAPNGADDQSNFYDNKLGVTP
jgi:general secretion pathway protein G